MTPSPTPPASTTSSSASSWWSTVTGSTSTWSRRLWSSGNVHSPSTPSSSSSVHRATGAGPTINAPTAPPPPSPTASSSAAGDNHDDTWQMVLTNHGHTSSLDGSSCPLVLPEPDFVQLPQLQPIHGVQLLTLSDGDDDSASETDDDDDEYVTRALPPLRSAAASSSSESRHPVPALARAADDPTVGSPLMSPSVPLDSPPVVEPLLVSTMDAYSLLVQDAAAGSQSHDDDDDDDDSEVEMSLDQLDSLMTPHLAPSTATPPSSTLANLSDSGVLVPIPTWAWHVLLSTHPSDALIPVPPPRLPPLPPTHSKKATSRYVASNKDLRRLASSTREALASRGCMGRFQRQPGPQPQGKQRTATKAGRAAAKSGV